MIFHQILAHAEEAEESDIWYDTQQIAREIGDVTFIGGVVCPFEVGNRNIGVGGDITIRELVELVARVVAFDGKLVFDASKPDGTSRNLLDV